MGERNALDPIPATRKFSRLLENASCALAADGFDKTLLALLLGTLSHEAITSVKSA